MTPEDRRRCFPRMFAVVDAGATTVDDWRRVFTALRADLQEGHRLKPDEMLLAAAVLGTETVQSPVVETDRARALLLEALGDAFDVHATTRPRTDGGLVVHLTPRRPS